MDNLESATYEVFEMDPVKYNAYEEAIRHALIDKKSQDGKVVVAVVGAGRGPIVDRVIRAAQSAGQKIRLYAVEKNPNAILTLRMKKEMQWGDSVQVVHADLRFWKPEEKVCSFYVAQICN